MIYEGRRSSRSNCAFFFERGSRRAENRIFERDARHPFSSNGATRVSSDLSSQIHHGNAPYPSLSPALPYLPEIIAEGLR